MPLIFTRFALQNEVSLMDTQLKRSPENGPEPEGISAGDLYALSGILTIVGYLLLAA